MLVYLTIFTTSFVIAFSGAMMPGPLMTMVIGQSARRGPWVGPKMIAGHAVLEIILLAAVFFGLTPLFKKDLFFILIALVGGGIMTWMAQSMMRSLPRLEIKTDLTDRKQMNLYLAGIIMSLAIPYWIIWWATIGLAYVLHSQKMGFVGVLVFLIGHVLGDLLWYSALSIVVGKGRKFFGIKMSRTLVGVCAVFLFLFALYLLYGGVIKLFNM